MNKTLKPVLALSIAALTLIAGCAKGDANTAYSAIKKDVKASLQVKSWDKACFSHTDAAKWVKANKDNLSEEQQNKAKENGNTVTVVYTFTLKDGKSYLGTGIYTVKDKKLTNIYAVDLLGGYAKTREGLEKGATDSWVTFGDLKK